MPIIRVASYNVENLFARPRVFNTVKWGGAEPVLSAFREANAIMSRPLYTPADKARLVELLLQLDIYRVNAAGAVKRKRSPHPRWAWLRKNRGKFDREPRDPLLDIEITAFGRGDWIGWIELAVEATDETSTRLTAQVIDEVGPDVLAVVEGEDRPSLVRFNAELLNNRFRHVMLLDGNDTRGIDVGIATTDSIEIDTIRSNVDTVDSVGTVFSRDCPEYDIVTDGGTHITVLVNHFKSQSGGGGSKRKRQADEVRRIVNRLVAGGQHVIVLGDLNEGPSGDGVNAVNFAELFDSAGPLVDCYTLPGFDVGPRPGTFDSCGVRNRLDYILISHSLVSHFAGGEVFRKGLWGSRKTRPTAWETYDTMTASNHQASDHALVYIDLDLP